MTSKWISFNWVVPRPLYSLLPHLFTLPSFFSSSHNFCPSVSCFTFPLLSSHVFLPLLFSPSSPLLFFTQSFFLSSRLFSFLYFFLISSLLLSTHLLSLFPFLSFFLLSSPLRSSLLLSFLFWSSSFLSFPIFSPLSYFFSSPLTSFPLLSPLSCCQSFSSLTSHPSPISILPIVLPILSSFQLFLPLISLLPFTPSPFYYDFPLFKNLLTLPFAPLFFSSSLFVITLLPLLLSCPSSSCCLLLFSPIPPFCSHSLQLLPSPSIFSLLPSLSPPISLLNLLFSYFPLLSCLPLLISCIFSPPSLSSHAPLSSYSSRNHMSITLLFASGRSQTGAQKGTSAATIPTCTHTWWNTTRRGWRKL